MLEWPKYHTKIWNRKYCLKKETTFLLIQSFGIQLVPCVNSQILTQTYISASIHLCLSLLFCSESYRGGNSCCLASDLHNNQSHQDCCTDCNTKTLEFVFQLHSWKWAQQYICLSPGISTERITEDSFPRCAKANYSDGKTVRWEGRPQSGSNSSPFQRGCLICSAKVFLSSNKYVVPWPDFSKSFLYHHNFQAGRREPKKTKNTKKKGLFFRNVFNKEKLSRGAGTTACPTQGSFCIKLLPTQCLPLTVLLSQ